MNIALPRGFRLAVAEAGFRKSGRADLALAFSDHEAVAAGVFTTNAFKAAPVRVGMELLRERSLARAVVLNAGQANACTGAEGLADCRLSQELVAGAVGIDAAAVLPASTGVIGQRMSMDKWRAALPALASSLGSASLEDFARAIMTTDAFPKYAGAKAACGGGGVLLAGAAKGAGMICPNMATMLSVVLCDALVDPGDWRAMFRRAVNATFNRATVDGDTSTNDTLYGLANGASGVRVTGADLDILEEALTGTLAELAYSLVRDGEGATKVLHISVSGAVSDEDAEKAARTVGHSQLVKTAMYGKDANWGRIVAAIGRCGAVFDAGEVSVSLCGVELFRHEQPTGLDFDALLEAPLQERDLRLDISLGSGPGSYTLLAADLTHDYVSINADYRS